MSKIETVWLVTFHGRDDDGVSPHHEVYATKEKALHEIAIVLKGWLADGSYINHLPTRKLMNTHLQREDYDAMRTIWNTYARNWHTPRDVFGIDLEEVPFNPAVHKIDRYGEGQCQYAPDHGAEIHGALERASALDRVTALVAADVAEHDRDCSVDPCDLCVRRANGEPCKPGCLGFRISPEGSLVPCDVCGLDEGEVESRVQNLLEKNPPAKNCHAPDTGCASHCRGWDVFDANRTYLEIERSDECGVFTYDEDAITAALRFLHEVTGSPYELLIYPPNDLVERHDCVKCGAPMFADTKNADKPDRCVECSDDRVMPWQKERGEDGWQEKDAEEIDDCCSGCGSIGSQTCAPNCQVQRHGEPFEHEPDADYCDHCNKEILGIPSCDHDNTLAEAIGFILCEPCTGTLENLPLHLAERRARNAVRGRGGIIPVKKCTCALSYAYPWHEKECEMYGK